MNQPLANFCRRYCTALVLPCRIFIRYFGLCWFGISDSKHRPSAGISNPAQRRSGAPSAASPRSAKQYTFWGLVPPPAACCASRFLRVCSRTAVVVAVSNRGLSSLPQLGNLPLQQVPEGPFSHSLSLWFCRRKGGLLFSTWFSNYCDRAFDAALISGVGFSRNLCLNAENRLDDYSNARISVFVLVATATCILHVAILNVVNAANLFCGSETVRVDSCYLELTLSSPGASYA